MNNIEIGQIYQHKRIKHLLYKIIKVDPFVVHLTKFNSKNNLSYLFSKEYIKNTYTLIKYASTPLYKTIANIK